MKAEEARKFLHLARLDTKLKRWRIFAVLLLVALIIGGIPKATTPSGPFIGFLEVEGVIVNDYERQRHLADFAANPNGKALLVRINSPGGTVVGGESLYSQLKSLSAVKPVAIVMGELATSAAYMASLGGERIFSYEGSVTGSIGVLLQSIQIKKMLSNFGIEAETFKSGEFKAAPNPLEEITPAVRKQTQATVDEIQDIFVNLVAQNRQLSHQRVKELADGKVFSGRQALQVGLIDELGGEQAALQWLKVGKQVDIVLPLRDIVPQDPPFQNLVERFGAVSKGIANIKDLANINALGGVLSIWLR